jgi:DNA invertase Pin-like site-specific DNA recombinase
MEAQLDELRRAGVQEDHLWFEVKSGVMAKRPRLELCLTQAVRGDTIVVTKLDRFGRSLRDLIDKLDDLEKRGIGFRSLNDSIDTTTAIGRLIFHIMGAMAQFERDLTAERTRRAIAYVRRKGAQVGALPKLSGKDEAKIEALLRSGVSAREVAKRFGVVRQTILNRPHLRKLVPRRKRNPKD